MTGLRVLCTVVDGRRQLHDNRHLHVMVPCPEPAIPAALRRMCVCVCVFACLCLRVQARCRHKWCPLTKPRGVVLVAVWYTLSLVVVLSCFLRRTPCVLGVFSVMRLVRCVSCSVAVSCGVLWRRFVVVSCVCVVVLPDLNVDGATVSWSAGVKVGCYGSLPLSLVGPVSFFFVAVCN